MALINIFLFLKDTMPTGAWICGITMGLCLSAAVSCQMERWSRFSQGTVMVTKDLLQLSCLARECLSSIFCAIDGCIASPVFNLLSQDSLVVYISNGISY